VPEDFQVEECLDGLTRSGGDGGSGRAQSDGVDGHVDAFEEGREVVAGELGRVVDPVGEKDDGARAVFSEKGLVGHLRERIEERGPAERLHGVHGRDDARRVLGERDDLSHRTLGEDEEREVVAGNLLLHESAHGGASACEFSGQAHRPRPVEENRE